jgi:ABC-type lipoprotein release transport system permease subunit
VPLVLMTVVSLLVALWPALRAARIKPVEALRQTGV